MRRTYECNGKTQCEGRGNKMTFMDAFLAVLITLTFIYDRFQCALLYKEIKDLEDFVIKLNDMTVKTLEAMVKHNAILNTKYDRSPKE